MDLRRLVLILVLLGFLLGLLLSNSFGQLSDLLLEELLGLGALQLESRGKHIVLHREKSAGEMDSLHLLEALQAQLFAHCKHVFHDGFLDLGVLDDFLKSVSLDVLFAGPRFQDFLVRYDNGDQEGVERVSVDKGLGDIFALGVDVFDLLGSNVFTLEVYM